MKLMMALFLVSIAALPMVEPVMAQAGPISAAKEVGSMSATMVLALIAVCSSGALFKMFQLWRLDVDQARAEAKESADLIRAVVSENSVALVSVNVSNQQLKDSVYHLSSVISNCEEVQKVNKGKG
jgi:hypothetical protein